MTLYRAVSCSDPCSHEYDIRSLISIFKIILGQGLYCLSRYKIFWSFVIQRMIFKEASWLLVWCVPYGHLRSMVQWWLLSKLEQYRAYTDKPNNILPHRHDNLSVTFYRLRFIYLAVVLENWDIKNGDTLPRICVHLTCAMWPAVHCWTSVTNSAYVEVKQVAHIT